VPNDDCSWIVGVGQSGFSRLSGRSPADLAAEAALAAAQDAGVDPKTIRAVIPLGGSLFTEDLICGLGLDPGAVTDATPPPGGNAAVTSLITARTVLRAGAADLVLIVLARNGASGARIQDRIRSLPGRPFREFLEQPYGWSRPAEWYSMLCRRYMHDHGDCKRAMAEVALVTRSNAQLNPAAMMYGRPLTLADYNAARWIADPYQLYDCCLETDGAVAVLLSSQNRYGRGVRIRGVASARPQSPDDLTNRANWYDIGLTASAPRAYEAAAVGPADINVALIYDCFTFEVIHQLEEAGFCPRGQAPQFILSGGTALGGRLPVNPHGGLLSEGHLGGLNHVAEAVRQLRHEAGARQVAGARLAAVTGWGDWGDGSLAVLERKAA